MKEKNWDKENLQGRFPETFAIENENWQLLLSAYGGQILKAFHRPSDRDVIFLGKKAVSGGGEAIRGGVPICWPWFGASPVEGRPIQGFARTSLWDKVLLQKDLIRLKLPSSAVPAELVDFPFELSSEIRLGDELEMTLVMKNCGNIPVDITCALHTYFAVSDCEKITVTGLENIPFSVKGGPEQPGEKGVLQIKGEICRLYEPQTNEVTIIDPQWQRKIFISKENSNSTLVWNPGAERCSQIKDLEDEEFHDFLCVECNRAGNDQLHLLPGVEHRMVQKIRVTQG